jgi:hypothetical protein
MYINKYIQKLAHTEIESESLEQLIDSTPGHWTVILSDDCGSPLKFRCHCVLGLVRITPWAEGVIRRAVYVELDCGFHTATQLVYSLPVCVEQNESLPIGLAIAPSEGREVYE